MRYNVSLFIAFCLLFSGISFSQLNEKSKTKKEDKKVEQVTVVKTDTCVTCTSTQVLSVPTFTLAQKHKTQLSDEDDYSEQSDVKEVKLRMKDFYPVPQYQGFLTYVSHKGKNQKVSGFDVTVNVRMGNSEKLLAGKKHVSTWGMFAEYGSYKIEVTERDETKSSIKVTQAGLGVSFARTRAKSSFNAFTINSGGFQEVEKGSHDLFAWQQVDLIWKTSAWLDLTRTSRKKTLLFSRTNVSAYYNKPVTTSRDATYDGEKVDSPVWDKESAGFEINQTLLMFYLGGNLGLHFGLAVGYDHYSATMQDHWTPAAFVELHDRDFKIAQIYFGKKINSSDERNPVDILRLSFDFAEIFRVATR